MSKFAFLFEGREGYLFVNNIGHPTNGEVQLVRSVADGRLYVRKKTYPTPMDANSTVTTCNEVKLYRPHPNIPKLIDWADEVYRESDFDRRQRSTTSFWEYCNGGDLATLLAKACETETALPEAFFWKLLLELLTILDFLHFGCQPAICQGDFHAGNIFLHWEDDSTILPAIKLVDFGLARIYNPGHWRDTADFSRLSDLLADITRQARARWVPTSPSQELISAIDRAKELYQQVLSSNADTVLTDSHGHVRTHTTSLLELIRPQYQQSLTSMSDRDREDMLRLKPALDTRVLMCDAPEALLTFMDYTGEHYDDEPEIPSGPCKIVEINADSRTVIRVVGDAGIEATVLPFDPETYEDLDDENGG